MMQFFSQIGWAVAIAACCVPLALVLALVRLWHPIQASRAAASRRDELELFRRLRGQGFSDAEASEAVASSK